MILQEENVDDSEKNDDGGSIYNSRKLMLGAMVISLTILCLFATCFIKRFVCTTSDDNKNNKKNKKSNQNKYNNQNVNKKHNNKNKNKNAISNNSVKKIKQRKSSDINKIDAIIIPKLSLQIVNAHSSNDATPVSTMDEKAECQGENFQQSQLQNAALQLKSGEFESENMNVNYNSHVGHNHDHDTQHYEFKRVGEKSCTHLTKDVNEDNSNDKVENDK